MNYKYNLLDLFSGIGGFHKGLSEAGFQFNKTYFSEIDKHAIAVYKYNFQEAEYAGTVKSIRGGGLRKSKSEKWIVTFGFPCQDVSLAGSRKGFSGTRSSLFFEATRIIRELQPEIFIAENVKGLFSSQGGRDFTAVLREFADMRDYYTEWQLLNTRWFLPQNRERIYLVGHSRNGSGRAVFPFRESNTKANNQQIKIYGDTNIGGQKGAVLATDGICSSLTATDYKQPKQIKIGTLRTYKDGRGFREVKEPICPTIPSRARNDGSGQPVIITHKGHKNKAPRTHDIVPTLTSESHGHDPMVQIKTNTKKGYEIVEKGDSINLAVPNSKTRRGRIGKQYSQTLETQCKQAVLVDKLRRLTPVECERLQGFPDSWTKIGNYNGEIKEVSDTQRYKMCGNAVSVPVVKAIGGRLK